MGLSLSPLVRALQNAVGRGANIVNHDIIDPFQRDIVQPVQRAPSQLVRVIQQAQRPVSQSQQAINNANQNFGFTQAFKDLLEKSKPVISSGPLSGNASGLFGVNKTPGSTIEVSNQGPTDDTLRHEGTHAAWASMSPEQKQEYVKILQKTLPLGDQQLPAQKSPRKYIGAYYNNYNGQQNNLPSYVGDVRQLPEDVLNEIHANLPAYYQQIAKQPLPPALRRYYSKYYNVGKAEERGTVVDTVNDMLNFDGRHSRTYED